MQSTDRPGHAESCAGVVHDTEPEIISDMTVLEVIDNDALLVKRIIPDLPRGAERVY
jgi:hypothetical protein